MSTVRDAINAIRETLILSEKIQRVAEGVAQLTGAVADHERRLIRLEAKWETAIELAAVQRPRQIDN
ncbi:MAG: hypothetical protein OZ927_07600 [Alcaligenaceae bacterium]|nr:hypothetical protein [Alcaligenaceae bacterium]